MEAELRRLHASAAKDGPIVATVVGRQKLEIGIGLGASESIVFVHGDRDGGTRDEWVSIGDCDATGVADFMFHGNHPTQFERRHLIPSDLAIQAVVDLFRTGRRTGDVEWTHNVV